MHKYFIFFALVSLSLDSYSQALEFGPVSIDFTEGNEVNYSSAIKVLLILTVLSLAPGILIVTTSFIRIIVVLSMLRQAFGMPATPPNTVLLSLALFLTFFTMSPTLVSIDSEAFQPYQRGDISFKQATDIATIEIKKFMISHAREEDMILFLEIANADYPKTRDDIRLVNLIPAFMLSELKVAFQIGFIIFLPFLLVDIIIASILMSMGMLMVPPLMISLPIKVLMFVLIDGWYLVVKSLVGSFL